MKCLKLSLKNLSLKSSLVRKLIYTQLLEISDSYQLLNNAKIVQPIPPDNSLPKYPRDLQPELVQKFGFVLCLLSQMINAKHLFYWEFWWQPEKTHAWKRKKLRVEEYTPKIDFTTCHHWFISLRKKWETKQVFFNTWHCNRLFNNNKLHDSIHIKQFTIVSNRLLSSVCTELES